MDRVQAETRAEVWNRNTHKHAEISYRAEQIPPTKWERDRKHRRNMEEPLAKGVVPRRSRPRYGVIQYLGDTPVGVAAY